MIPIRHRSKDRMSSKVKCKNHRRAVDERILDRIAGSMVGMAVGDALGAHVEFRPRQYMVENPVKDLEGGGTWGLKKGQVWLLLPFRSRTSDECQ